MLLGAAARRRYFPLLFIIVIGFVRSCNAGGQENTNPRHDPSGEEQDRLIDGEGAGDLENAPEAGLRVRRGFSGHPADRRV